MSSIGVWVLDIWGVVKGYIERFSYGCLVELREVSFGVFILIFRYLEIGILLYGFFGDFVFFFRNLIIYFFFVI